MTRVHINRADFYLAGWCLYYLQGTLYEEGSIISQSILLLLLAFSAYTMAYMNRHYKLNTFFHALNLLVLMFTIYGAIELGYYGMTMQIDGSTHRNIDYLRQLYLSLLPIYSFTLLSMQGYLTEKKLRAWVIIFLAVATASYFYEYRMRLKEAVENGSLAEEFTNNGGYTFLALLPLSVLFRKRPWIQYMLLAYCGYFIINGMKRGAMLIGALCMLIIIFDSIKAVGRNAVKVIPIIGMFLAVIVFSVIKLSSSSDFFHQRVEQTMGGDTSNRDVIYADLLNLYYQEQDLGRLVFGYGADGTLITSFTYAHNDWLEILINHGLIGILAFLFFWIAWGIQFFKLKGDNTRRAFGLILFICFSKTFISMSINDMLFYITSVLGLYLGLEEREGIIRSDGMLPQKHNEIE